MKDLNEIFSEGWDQGHYSFTGDQYHTGRRFNSDRIQRPEFSEPIEDRLIEVLLEANPDCLLDLDYEGYAWMDRIRERLEQRVGHPVGSVTLFGARPIPKGLERLRGNRAVLFLEVMTFGTDPQKLAWVATKFHLQPEALLTILDRSPIGLYDWEGLPIGAIRRQPVEVWPKNECLMCQGGRPLDMVALDRG